LDDVFCEYDAKFSHTKKSKVGITIDFRQGVYWQRCYACSPAGATLKKYSIFGSYGIKISNSVEDGSHCKFMDIDTNVCYSMIAESFKYDLYTTTDGDERCYVFDGKNMLWVTGSAANIHIQRMQDKFWDHYCT
jgi:hypothetical protein